MKWNRVIPVGLVMASLVGCSSPRSEIAPTDNYTTEAEIKGKIVVDLRDDMTSEEISQFAKDYNLDLTPTVLFDRTKMEVAVRNDEGDDEEDLITRLKHDSRVEIAEPLMEVHVEYVPNDPMYGEQWGLQRIGTEKAWDYASGRGVAAAVVDTGIAFYSEQGYKPIPDLVGVKRLDGFNFIDPKTVPADNQSHGSHVAGSVSQATGNGIGAAGVAFNSSLMAVKVLDQHGSGSNASVADGIVWAGEHGVQIINLSLGGSHSSVMDKAVESAYRNGVLVVCAAGNESRNEVSSPASAPHAFAVSASDEKDNIATFSNRGKGVFIGSPGVNILQNTICKGSDGKDGCADYLKFSGTSMASPILSGSAALVESLGVSNPDRVAYYLSSTAREVGSKNKEHFGAGIVDAAAAVRSVTFDHLKWRLGFLFVFTLWLARKAKQSPLSLRYALPALFSSVGLFFFAPFVASRSDLIVDILARPLADMDLLFAGFGLHKFLPFASMVIPFSLLTVFYKVKSARLMVSGLACGSAAYLASTLWLNELYCPYGRAVQALFFGASLLGNLWIARQGLCAERSKVEESAESFKSGSEP